MKMLALLIHSMSGDAYESNLLQMIPKPCKRCLALLPISP